MDPTNRTLQIEHLILEIEHLIDEHEHLIGELEHLIDELEHLIIEIEHLIIEIEHLIIEIEHLIIEIELTGSAKKGIIERVEMLFMFFFCDRAKLYIFRIKIYISIYCLIHYLLLLHVSIVHRSCIDINNLYIDIKTVMFMSPTWLHSPRSAQRSQMIIIINDCLFINHFEKADKGFVSLLTVVVVRVLVSAFTKC